MGSFQKVILIVVLLLSLTLHTVSIVLPEFSVEQWNPKAEAYSIRVFHAQGSFLWDDISIWVNTSTNITTELGLGF